MNDRIDDDDFEIALELLNHPVDALAKMEADEIVARLAVWCDLGRSALGKAECSNPVKLVPFGPGFLVGGRFRHGVGLYSIAEESSWKHARRPNGVLALGSPGLTKEVQREAKVMLDSGTADLEIIAAIFQMCAAATPDQCTSEFAWASLDSGFQINVPS